MRLLLPLASLAVVAVGCDSVLGLDDFVPEPDASAASGSGAAASTGTGATGPGSSSGGGGSGAGSCELGETVECYSGPAGTEDIGPCHTGTSSCDPDTLELGACEGQVIPEAEDCQSFSDQNCARNCAEPIWINHYGSVEDDGGGRIATLMSGDIALLGGTWGAMTIGSASITGSEEGPMFLALFTPEGSPKWAAAYPANANDMVVQGTTLYVGGGYGAAGDVDFGNGALTGSGGFVARFAEDGTAAWSKTIGGANDWVTRMVVSGSKLFVLANLSQIWTLLQLDATTGSAVGTPKQLPAGVTPFDLEAHGGYIYLAGHFAGTADFGVTLTAPGAGGDGFVVRYSELGVLLWARQLSASSTGRVHHIDVNDNGVFATGLFNGTIDTPSGLLVSSGASSTLLTRLDPTGQMVYGKAFAASKGERVVADQLGNCFFVGTLGMASTDLGGGTLDGAPFDTLLGAFAPDGTHLWSRVTPWQVSSASLGGMGHVLVTGSYAGGSKAFDGTMPTAEGGTDVFLARLAPMGL